MMEAGNDYGVRIIRAFGQFSVGNVIFPPGTQRSDLIRRGMVELVKAPSAAPEPPKRKAAREQ